MADDLRRRLERAGYKGGPVGNVTSGPFDSPAERAIAQATRKVVRRVATRYPAGDIDRRAIRRVARQVVTRDAYLKPVIRKARKRLIP